MQLPSYCLKNKDGDYKGSLKLKIYPFKFKKYFLNLSLELEENEF